MIDILGISAVSLAALANFAVIVITENRVREAQLRQMYQRLGLE